MAARWANDVSGTPPIWAVRAASPVRVSGRTRSAPLSIEHLQRTSDRGAATRGALLAAAREVFSVSGFAQAAVTDIVARAGASVGSLYHHFSGKADLYLTLFEEFQTRQQERTRE